jgi:TPR repeat protein
MLGTMYAEGRRVPKDRNEAVKWLLMAAEQGTDYECLEARRELHALSEKGDKRAKEALLKIYPRLHRAFLGLQNVPVTRSYNTHRRRKTVRQLMFGRWARFGKSINNYVRGRL